MNKRKRALNLRHFLLWTQCHGESYIPASYVTVCNFIADLASGNMSKMSKFEDELLDGYVVSELKIKKYLEDIKYLHQVQGFTVSPTDHHLVKEVLKGIKKYHHRNKVRKYICKLLT